MNKGIKHYKLTPIGIDSVSEDFSGMLGETALDHHDTVRLRLILEEILLKWMNKAEGEPDVILESGRKFRRSFIRISVEGPGNDPTVRNAEVNDEDSSILFDRLLAQSGMSFSYSYKNGYNTLTLNPPMKNPRSQTNRMLIALVAAIVTGVITMLCPDSVTEVAQKITDPLFGALLGLLNAIAAPMIFLSICAGLFMIGDLSSIGKVAGKTLQDMLISMLVVGILVVLCIFWMFPISSASGTTGTIDGFYSIYEMFLDILPGNIIAPFFEGKMLQIIFIGFCVGITLLILGEKSSMLRTFITQAYDLVTLLMNAIGKLVPLFIFLSLYSLIISGVLENFKIALQCVLITIIASWAVNLIQAVFISLKFKVKLSVIIRKMWKTHFIALTTASSAAAFGINLDTCENKLGISPRLTRFAVPMGQTLYMPTTEIVFIAAGLTMAAAYDVPITVPWLIMLVIICVLLAMATTPVPGGALMFYTVLFLQLGIPAEALAIVLPIDMLLDYILTATSVTSLQELLVFSADKLGLLNRDILVSEQKTEKE